MDQPIINSNNPDEQLIYPTSDNSNLLNKNDSPPKDDYYIENLMAQEKIRITSLQIVRTDINTFSLKRKGNTIKAIWLFILPIIAIFIVYFSDAAKNYGYIVYILLGISFLIMASVGLYLLFWAVDKIYLVLSPGSIISRNKSRCKTKDITYNIDEIEGAELYYNYIRDSEGSSHVYKIHIVQKTGEKILIHRIESYKKDIELNGLKYFVDLLNDHIKKNR